MQEFAREAERAGATALWTCDHVFWHRPLLEPLIALGVVAAATETAAIGTCVLQLPIRNPAVVARQAATLQLLSGGRFFLGVGVGSHPGEYEAAGADFGRRGRALDAGIDALRRAWSSTGTSELRYRMEPPVPTVPVWVAGASDAALARTARAGDGWVPLFLPADAYEQTRRRLFDLAHAAGRDPDDLQTAAVAVVCTGDSEEQARKSGTVWLSDLYDLPPRAFERHLIAGSPEDCAAGIAAYHEAGAEHVVLMVAADETLEHFGPVLEALGSPPSRPLPRIGSEAPSPSGAHDEH